MTSPTLTISRAVVESKPQYGRFIRLNDGYFAVVDEEDYESINKHEWRVKIPRNPNVTPYATSATIVSGKMIFMHRLIIKTRKGKITDHINRNGLDNRKVNLRQCTISQNTKNRVGIKRENTKYKGIHFNSPKNKWRAQIMVNYKTIHLGSYTSQEEAAKAYNKAAIKYHGEFACLNQL